MRGRRGVCPERLPERHVGLHRCRARLPGNDSSRQRNALRGRRRRRGRARVQRRPMRRVQRGGRLLRHDHPMRQEELQLRLGCRRLRRCGKRRRRDVLRNGALLQRRRLRGMRGRRRVSASRQLLPRGQDHGMRGRRGDVHGSNDRCGRGHIVCRCRGSDRRMQWERQLRGMLCGHAVQPWRQHVLGGCGVVLRWARVPERRAGRRGPIVRVRPDLPQRRVHRVRRHLVHRWMLR